MGKHKETKSDTITVRMTPRIKAAFESLADQEGQTVSLLASNLLADWIQEHHPDLIPPPPELPPKLPDGVFRIPLYDVHAAAGSGSFITEENLETYLGFTQDLANNLGIEPKHLAGLRYRGTQWSPSCRTGMWC